MARTFITAYDSHASSKAAVAGRGLNNRRHYYFSKACNDRTIRNYSTSMDDIFLAAVARGSKSPSSIAASSGTWNKVLRLNTAKMS